MKTIRYIFSLVIAGSTVMAVSSCGKGDPNSPGVEFMPDMYRSPSLETNMMQNYMGDSMMVNRTPVAGTIARGYMPEMYTPADSNGYEMAGQNLHNPLAMNDQTLTEGKDLYTKYCVHCHGGTGAGDGPVGGKLPGPPPSYTSPPLMALPEGKMFYSVSFGKGMMGPHALLLTQDERWKIISYIRHDLQKQGQPAGTGMPADSTNTAKRENAKGSTDSQPGGTKPGNEKTPSDKTK
jgi:mono/diheme cytochrome c family protein